MTHYGRYETVEELYRGPLGHVAMAHLMGDDEADEFVVKAFDPALMGLLEADAATQTFLDRAGLQKLLADRGCAHWAPIYEMKATAEGAYYVTDYYPLTARKLLDARADLPAADLHWLIRSVVQGLLELRSSRKRAHGNLKPGNVLISSRGSLQEAGVFLADPGPGGRGAEDRLSDLRAVGRLIHQLVLHRPFEGEQDWPVPDGPQWSRLGQEGRGWRDLCRQLLDPESRPEDVEALAAAVEGLAPRPPARRRHLLALTALPVVALLVGIGFVASNNRTSRDELAAVDRAWFTRFASTLEDAGRRERFRADPDLAPVVQELESAEARHLPLDTAPPTGLPLTGGDQTRQTLAAVKRIQIDLSPGHWRRLADAEALQKRCEQWGWKQPAEFLAKLIEGTRPGSGRDVAAGIDRFLRVEPRGSAEIEAAQELWKPFDADLRAVEQAHDHTLTPLAASLRRGAMAPLRMEDGGLAGLEELKVDAPLARRLAGIAGGGWPANYGLSRLASEVESRLNMADPSTAEVRQWVEAVPGYALVPLNESSEAVAALRRAYNQAKADIDRQTFGTVERLAVDRAEADVDGRIRKFSQARYLQREAATSTGELATGREAVQREIEALRKDWVRLDDPREWLAFVEQPPSVASDRLKQRWKQWVDAQRARSAALATDHDAFVAAKQAAEQVKTALTALDQKFPSLPVGLSEKFSAAAWDRREQELADLSAWAVPRAGAAATTGPAAGPAAPLPPADSSDALARAAKFGDWLKKLEELSHDFPVTRELLTLEDRPDLKWKQKAPEFWNDPTVQTLVRGDVSRLENLGAVAEASREQLVGLATGSNVPEIVLAAWSRLGQAGGSAAAGAGTAGPAVTPPWPTQKGELDAELAIRTRLAALLKALKNAGEATAPAELLKQQGPVRWRRYTDLADPELLPASARLFRAFAVDESEVNKLSPPAHFDFFLYLAKVAAMGGRDEQVTAAVENLKVSGQAVKDRAGVAELIARLGHVADPAPMNDARLFDQKPGDTYKLAIKDSPYSIQFVRVAAPGVRPFYLATTEMSIGTFIDAVSSAGAWPAANALLPSLVPGGAGNGSPGPVRGPQAWARSANPAQPIARFETWRFDDGRNPAQQFDFAPELRQTKFNRHTLASDLGGNPQEEHPMQQVPAQAALYAAGLLNCRLPTAREWRAAYDLYEARTDVHQWNLRDQTFRKQLDYHAQGAPNQWPDNGVSGAFWPGDRLRPGQPNCRDTDDSTLLFRKVDRTDKVNAPGGSTFLNLVGNVAEFVCDAPEAFDGLADRRSADAVGRFAAGLVDARPRAGEAGAPGNAPARGGKLFVIGGSALSAPELDVTRPYPLASATEPFADVGFRLAFTAPTASLAERLRWAIEDQPWLPPAGPPATAARAAR